MGAGFNENFPPPSFPVGGVRAAVLWWAEQRDPGQRAEPGGQARPGRGRLPKGGGRSVSRPRLSPSSSATRGGQHPSARLFPFSSRHCPRVQVFKAKFQVQVSLYLMSQRTIVLQLHRQGTYTYKIHIQHATYQYNIKIKIVA